MRYDALQATLQKRFSNGLQGQIAYTYSKCMTDSIGYFGSVGQAATASAYWQNLYDSAGRVGTLLSTMLRTSSQVPRLRNSIGPNGDGERISSARQCDDRRLAIGRYRATSRRISTHHSCRRRFRHQFSGVTRQLRCACSRVRAKTRSRSVKRSIPGLSVVRSCLLWAAAPGTFGTCGVGTVRGPGLSTADLSIQKQFPLSEHKRFEFRAEFFNVTNTPILNSPNTFLTYNPGLIDSSQGERNIQFALKFHY